MQTQDSNTLATKFNNFLTDQKKNNHYAQSN